MTTKIDSLEHILVDVMPKPLEPAKLYISIKYNTTSHLCAAGGGKKAVLPISPAEWKLYCDGQAVSVSPSAANWEFPCRSHYWIRKGRIEWAPAWEDSRIEWARPRDEEALDDHFSARSGPSSDDVAGVRRRGLFDRFRK